MITMKNKCIISVCNSLSICKNLCQKHYDHEHRKKYYIDNREQIIKRTSEYQKLHPEIRKKSYKKWRKSNPKKAFAATKSWQKANPDRVRAYKRVYGKTLSKATPKWLSKEERKKILDLYENRLDGYEVDHIVALKNKDACGLHVLKNLRYLPAKENLFKSNKSVSINILKDLKFSNILVWKTSTISPL